MHLFGTTFVLGLFAASPGLAQMGNPGTMAPGTAQERPGFPAPNQTNNVDKLFIRLVGISGHSEVDAGMLARRKSENDAIKAFASRMVDDHSKANVRLEAAAKKAGISVPDAPDAEHKGTYNHLDQVNGRQFDVDYMNAQIADHLKAAQLLSWEIGGGQDEALQHFAAETLPIVLDHLQMARSLMNRLHEQAINATPKQQP